MALIAVAQAAEETAEEDEEENDMDDDASTGGGGPPHVVAGVARSQTSRRAAPRVAAHRVGLRRVESRRSDRHGGRAHRRARRVGMRRLLPARSRALRWCPDAASGDQVRLAQLVAAHASLLPEWDAWEEEEEEAALEVLDDVSASFKRGALVVRDVNDMRPLFESYGQFIGTAIDQAPALGCARACRRSHALMALAANVGGDASAGVARKILGAATDRLRGLVSPDLPVARPLVLAASERWLAASAPPRGRSAPTSRPTGPAESPGRSSRARTTSPPRS